MVQFPAPPRFHLPPPPMPPSDLFDPKFISQLTCSLIQQEQYQQTLTTTRLFLLAVASCLVALILFIITLIWLLSFRRHQQQVKSTIFPGQSVDSVNDWSTISNRSYETISTDHTGPYIQSLETSATTCSMETTSIVCIECQRQFPSPYYHVVDVPDVVPN